MAKNIVFVTHYSIRNYNLKSESLLFSGGGGGIDKIAFVLYSVNMEIKSNGSKHRSVCHSLTVREKTQKDMPVARASQVRPLSASEILPQLPAPPPPIVV
jgi:hypothetical protein